MCKFMDLTGQVFGRLTVVSRAEDKGGRVSWNCRCECGNNSIVKGRHLRSGCTRSCGCLSMDGLRERFTSHGMRKSKEYKTWQGMIQRCTNPSAPNYSQYGGRGVGICNSWLKFENFFADMGSRPKGMTLDRIDNDGNYDLENCRWATDSEQHRNKRNNVMVTFNGKIKCLAAWAEEAGMIRDTLHTRLVKLNWSIEKSLTTPVKKKKLQGECA